MPLEQVPAFGMFDVLFGAVVAAVRNTRILWLLFYPVASGMGALPADFVMDWAATVMGAALLAVQAGELVAAFCSSAFRPRYVERPRQEPESRGMARWGCL